MSKWVAIENNLADGNETAIVGWEAEEETGITIAIINHETKTVEYYDEEAKADAYAQEKINEVLKENKNGIQK